VDAQAEELLASERDLAQVKAMGHTDAKLVEHPPKQVLQGLAVPKYEDNQAAAVAFDFEVDHQTHLGSLELGSTERGYLEVSANRVLPNPTIAHQVSSEESLGGNWSCVFISV
jgi:hypothetical protein